MLCSLSYSADSVSYVRKQLTDSTTIVKLTIPEDSDVYTCLDTKTYTRTIKTVGECKFDQKELGLCRDNLTRYDRIDSLHTYNVEQCKGAVADIKKFNDELFTKLQEERQTKWYWIIGAFAAGTVVGSITINLSN